MTKGKLSGAMLAAELQNLPDRDFNPPIGTTPASVSAEQREPQPPVEADIEGQAPAARRKLVGSKSRGGRPSKAGVDGIPVNVRLSQGDHLALAKLSTKLMTPGRPLPTVQDVVRSLLRGALSEPDMAMRLCRKVGDQQ